MKASKFKSWEIIYWVDYSNMDDCIDVFDVSDNIFEKQENIERINNEFNLKIREYLSKYPEEEQKQFANKLAFAREVVNGGGNIYITQIAKTLGIAPLDFAKIIIEKSEAFQVFYVQCEIERNEQLEQYLELTK